MAVILELAVAPEDLQIGRVLPLSGEQSVRLESLVPISGEVVPFVRVQNLDSEAFQAIIDDDSRVDTVERFTCESDENLFAVDWRIRDDPLFDAIDASGGYVLEGAGAPDAWWFRIRFPDRAAVTDFDARLGEAAIPFGLTTLYQETAPSPGLRFGLTHPQREALVAAVDAGYFDIPRDVTTTSLAAEFGISDQAFIERLRRAVSNLAEHTVMSERTA